MFWIDSFEKTAARSSAVCAFAGSWLLQSAALILLGLLAARLLRNKGAACASAVYRAALAAVLVCPLLTLAFQTLGIPCFLSLPMAFSPAATAESAAVPAEKTPVPAENLTALAAAPVSFAPPLIAETPAPSSLPPPAGLPLRVSSNEAPEIAESSPASPPADWLPLAETVLTVSWLAVSGILLIRFAKGWRGAVLLRRSAGPVDGKLTRLCETLAARIGVPAPSVLQSPFLSSPVLLGLRKPSIVLPEETPEPEKCKAIFAHELAHLARGDVFWNFLAHLSTAVLFFQPLLWLIVRRLGDSAEEVCDDYVVRFGFDRIGYARRLVEIAERYQPLPIAGVGVLSLRSSIRRRIDRILDTSRRLSTRLGRRAVLLIAMISITATCLAGLLAFGEDQAAAPPESAGHSPTPDAGDRPHSADAKINHETDPQTVVIRRGEKYRIGDMVFSYEEGGDALTVYNSAKPRPAFPTGLLMHIKMQLPDQINRIDGYEVKILGRAPDRVKAAVKKIKSQEKYGYGIYFGMKPGETVGFEGGSLKIKRLSTERLTARGDASVWFEATTPAGTETFEMVPAVQKDVGFCTVWIRSATDEEAHLELMVSPSRYRQVQPARIARQAPPDKIPSAAGDPHAQVEPIFQGLRENWDRRGDFARAKWSRMSTIQKAQFINYWGAQGTLRGANWSPSDEEAARFVAEQTRDDSQTQRPRLEMILDGVRSYMTPKDSAVFDAVENALINQLASLGTPAVDGLIDKIRTQSARKGSEREVYWATQALARMGEPAVTTLVRELERVADDPYAAGFERNYLIEAFTLNRGLPPKEIMRRWLNSPQYADAGLDCLALNKLAQMPGELTEKKLLRLWETVPRLRPRAGELLGDRGGREALKIFQRDIPTAYAQARFEAEAAAWQIKKRLGLPIGEYPPTPRRLKKGDDSPLWEGFEKSLKSPNKAIRLEALGHLKWVAEHDAGYLPMLADAAERDPDPEVRLKAAEDLKEAKLNAERAKREKSEPAAMTGRLNEIFRRLDQAIRHARKNPDPIVVNADNALLRQSSQPGKYQSLNIDTRFDEDAVRKAQAKAIDEMAALGPAAVPLLLEAENRTPLVQQAYDIMIVDALMKIGKPAIPALVKAASDSRPNIRDMALFALIISGDNRAIDPLLQRLQDKNGYNAIGAIDALGRFRDPRIVESLLRLWNQGRFRSEVASALGHQGDQRAVAPLMAACGEALDDAKKTGDWNKQFALMRNSAWALGALGDPAAVPLLKKMLEAEPAMDLDKDMSEKKFYGVADNAAASLRKFGYQVKGDMFKGGYRILAEPADGKTDNRQPAP
jgi:beta-lactamase regulating signal transducer with metallopeptidase domain/HEAT repeat protein